MTSRRLWVTGGHGFVGRHVAMEASRSGWVVDGVGHGNWPESERNLVGLSDWLNGDVCVGNLDILARCSGLPDAIIHLAGGSSVGPSMIAPAEDFRRTVGATADLLEWVRLHSSHTKVVLASSAAVYGGSHSGQIGLASHCIPYSPYGTHKLMSEMMLRGFGRDFEINGAIVRLFSVYGAGLRKQLLWDLCGKLATARGPVVLGGTGAELRDWLHVEDAARLLLCAVDVADETCPILNGGTGVAASVRDVADWICSCWSASSSASFSGVRRAGDPGSLVADVSATTELLGWQPLVSWRDGMSGYIDWFRALRQEGQR
jgi:UDP-glucose 4-epimerase